MYHMLIVLQVGKHKFTVAIQPETAHNLSQPPADGRNVNEHNDWECDLKHREALKSRLCQ